MGTIVFPDAVLKIYLTASAEARAQRRFLELKQRGLDVKIDKLIADIKERDERDINRPVAPLVPAEDAITIDTTELNAIQAFDKVVSICLEKKLID
jgi:cytidylate kinase